MRLLYEKGRRQPLSYQTEGHTSPYKFRQLELELPSLSYPRSDSSAGNSYARSRHGIRRLTGAIALDELFDEAVKTAHPSPARVIIPGVL